jgi:hypothetical protein
VAGNDKGVAAHLGTDTRIDEVARPQRFVQILENRLEPDGRASRLPRVFVKPKQVFSIDRKRPLRAGALAGPGPRAQTGC